MQDVNDKGDVLRGGTGELADLMGLKLAEGATHRVISTLPEKGEVVIIRGLRYIVKGGNNENGQLRLKLMGVDEK